MPGCVTKQAGRAYLALVRAAEKIGAVNYRRGLYRRRGYSVTPEHAAVVQAAADVCGGKISPDDAMGLLLQYDVFEQRFPQEMRRSILRPGLRRNRGAR